MFAADSITDIGTREESIKDGGIWIHPNLSTSFDKENWEYIIVFNMSMICDNE